MRDNVRKFIVFYLVKEGRQYLTVTYITCLQTIASAQPYLSLSRLDKTLLRN